MYKDKRTYIDFNGTERTEEFYFNLTEAELTEMQLSTNGGLDQYIDRIIATMDGSKIIALFKELICKAYGVKTLDGKGFKKSPELLAEYTSTQAFSDLYMELATNDKVAADFVNGITPSVTKAKAEAAENVVPMNK